MDTIFPPAVINFLKLQPLHVEYALQSFYQRVGTQVWLSLHCCWGPLVTLERKNSERLSIRAAEDRLAGTRLPERYFGATVRRVLDLRGF